MSGATPVVGLALEPLDVLFFRDARPFGAASIGMSRWPNPSTIAGAIRTSLLQSYAADFSRLGAAIRDGAKLDEAVSAAGAPPWIATVEIKGPWVRRREEVLVPLPSTLHRVKGDGSAPLTRLDPCNDELPGWIPGRFGIRPLWRRGVEATEPVRGWMTPRGLEMFLNGGVPDTPDLVPDGSLYTIDHRTGVQIEPDRSSAEDGKLYGAGFLALARDVRLHINVTPPPAAPTNTFERAFVLALGGERRHARAVPCDPWVPPRVSKQGTGDLVMLLSPGLFADGWRPRGFPTPIVAASVPGHLAISGWDLARGGAKPNRFAVPPGSVYFLERGAASAFEDSVAEESEDRLQGFGAIVKGVWNHA